MKDIFSLLFYVFAIYLMSILAVNRAKTDVNKSFRNVL